ncbi:MAG: hypothetical protein J6N51_13535 [Selenomonas sp.]|nr:hypothetical protein [Selenomonas sp.]
MGTKKIMGKRAGKGVEKAVKTPPHSSKSSKEQKRKLLDMLARLSTDELALVMATGLKCEHCPVAGEKGACYDKVVCCKTMSQWLGEEQMACR